jgi:hypothetical protein
MCTRTEIGARREVTRPGLNFTLSMISRAGSETLVIGIDVLPFARRIWPSGPDGVVVVVVVAVVVGVDVDVVVPVEVDEVLDVELVVEPVEVESVLVDVVSAKGLSGPAKPALAK